MKARHTLIRLRVALGDDADAVTSCHKEAPPVDYYALSGGWTIAISIILAEPKDSLNTKVQNLGGTGLSHRTFQLYS